MSCALGEKQRRDQVIQFHREKTLNHRSLVQVNKSFSQSASKFFLLEWASPLQTFYGSSARNKHKQININLETLPSGSCDSLIPLFSFFLWESYLVPHLHKHALVRILVFFSLQSTLAAPPDIPDPPVCHQQPSYLCNDARSALNVAL